MLNIVAAVLSQGQSSEQGVKRAKCPQPCNYNIYIRVVSDIWCQYVLS